MSKIQNPNPRATWRCSPLLVPKDLRPASCELSIVCGAPASGKTTWAKANAENVIDLDEIMKALSGYEKRGAPISYLSQALHTRNDLLRGLDRETRSTAFIVSAPDCQEREHWQISLGARRVVVVDPGMRVCRNRITADDDRTPVRRRLINAVRNWYRDFTPYDGDETIGAAIGHQYAALHNSRQWRKLRAAHLKEHPLCVRCLDQGIVNDGSLTATGQPQTNKRRRSLVVDHVHQHHGDPELFYSGELQTLCADHHDKSKQIEEHKGYSTETGLDGWPVDDRHPGSR